MNPRTNRRCPRRSTQKTTVPSVRNLRAFTGRRRATKAPMPSKRKPHSQTHVRRTRSAAPSRQSVPQATKPPSTTKRSGCGACPRRSLCQTFGRRHGTPASATSAAGPHRDPGRAVRRCVGRRREATTRSGPCTSPCTRRQQTRSRHRRMRERRNGSNKPKLSPWHRTTSGKTLRSRPVRQTRMALPRLGLRAGARTTLPHRWKRFRRRPKMTRKTQPRARPRTIPSRKLVRKTPSGPHNRIGARTLRPNRQASAWLSRLQFGQSIAVAAAGVRLCAVKMRPHRFPHFSRTLDQAVKRIGASARLITDDAATAYKTL
mmetsp:Transcript_3494/g.10831  ORF Transcript_3494/g.10831 Transcript_3494/m.10831 type:complete len:317 (+) Transcript_3494:369-1319(+)